MNQRWLMSVKIVDAVQSIDNYRNSVTGERVRCRHRQSIDRRTKECRRDLQAYGRGINLKLTACTRGQTFQLAMSAAKHQTPSISFIFPSALFR